MGWIYANGFIDTYNNVTSKKLVEIMGEKGKRGSDDDLTSFLPCGAEGSLDYQIIGCRIFIKGAMRWRQDDYIQYVKRWFKTVLSDERMHVCMALLSIESSSGKKEVVYKPFIQYKNEGDKYIYAEIVQ